jgi:ketosteroid isomerase-like protein
MPLASFVFLLSAVFCSGGAQPVREEAGELALRYLEHLYGSELEALEEITSDDLLFHDATSSVFPGGPWRYEGRAQVLDFFRRSIQGVESQSFEVLRRFTSGEQTVLELTYRTRGDGAALGYPGVILKLEVPAVTVIRVRDGLVVEHEDFVDYPTMMKQVKEQTASKR